MKQMDRSVLWILLFTYMTSFAVYAQKEERKNVRDGNSLYKQEKYTEAEIAYRKGLEVNPRSAEGSYNLGNSLYKQKKYPEALEQYQLLLGQTEKMKETEKGIERLSDVFHNIGNISMQTKEYGKSVEAYKQSLRLNPYNDETRYNLALAQKLLENQQQDQQDQQDQNKDDKEDRQQQDQKQDQQQNQNENKKDNKTQEQPRQQPEQMSKDNAQQMLDAFLQDEKDTQEKVKKAQAQQQQRRKTDKEW